LAPPTQSGVKANGAEHGGDLHVPAAQRFDLLDNYGKDDLSADEKKQLRQLAARLKHEAVVSYQRWLMENG